MIHNVTRSTATMPATAAGHIPSDPRIAEPLVTPQTLDDARFAMDSTVRTRMLGQLGAVPLPTMCCQILNHRIPGKIIKRHFLIHRIPNGRLGRVHPVSKIPTIQARRNDEVVHGRGNAADFRGIVAALMSIVVACCGRIRGFSAVKVVLRARKFISADSRSGLSSLPPATRGPHQRRSECSPS